MKKSIFTAAMLGSLLVMDLAAAGPKSHDATMPKAEGAMPSFEAVDRDKDEVISAKEAKSVEGLSLKEADRDGDGLLSREEYQAAVDKVSKR